jgi:NADH-quinone oxidoreductase subunit I
LAEGFGTTLKHLGRKPITEQYPEYKRPLPERSRARIILTCDPDGDERCVACFLCSAACPVSCISMEAAEREKDGRRYAGGSESTLAAVFTAAFAKKPVPLPPFN